MKYKGYALVFDEVEADNEEQAREKIADKLGNDYFSWFDSNEIVLHNELKPENKGEWKRISPAGIYECSCCGQNVMTSDIECYKFCHGCGADMRKGET